MFISPAFAQSAGAPGAGGDLIGFLPLVLIFVIFYFLLIRPQQKRAKEHKELLSAVRRGDKIVTGGGVIGVVVKVGQPEDPEVLVEIAENVRVKILRATISNVLARTEPVKTETAAPAAGGEVKRGFLDKLLSKK